MPHDPDKPDLLIGDLVAPTGEVRPDKKLIQTGGPPLIAYARNHIQQMEQAPFDGIGLTLPGRASHDFFGHREIAENEAERAVADLKATDFRRFKHNFLWAFTVPDGSKRHPHFHGDWFKDNNWEAKLHNARLSARVAKKGGLKGILFDTEMYHGQVFDYTFQKHRDQYDFATYNAETRDRGRQWIRTINEVYPDIEIIFFVAGWHSYIRMFCDPQWPFEENAYGLFSGFMDGIMDAATPPMHSLV